MVSSKSYLLLLSFFLSFHPLYPGMQCPCLWRRRVRPLVDELASLTALLYLMEEESSPPGTGEA